MANLHLAIELARVDDITLSAMVAEKFAGPWCRCTHRPATEPEGYCGRCRKQILHFAYNLDACHEAELTLQENGFLRYRNILQDVLGAEGGPAGARNYRLAMAVPRDRCIALLLSKEK